MSKRHTRGRFPYVILLISLLGVLALLCAGTVQIRAEEKPAAAFVGSDTCAECHDEVDAAVKKSPHGMAMLAVERKGNGRTCEGCHGPGSLHVEDPSTETAAPLRAASRTGDGCLSCHKGTLSRTEWLHAGVKHSGVTCLDCHASPHPARTVEPNKQGRTPAAKPVAPVAQPFDHAQFSRVPPAATCLSCHPAQRAQFALPSHHPVNEKRVTCTDCHTPHKPSDDRIKRDTCVRCHQQQRGPFLFEHGATSAHLTDACLDCHNPHGSPHKRLQKFSGRGQCLQCHGDRAVHYTGQNCANCHTAVHGSNSSALLFTK